MSVFCCPHGGLIQLRGFFLAVRLPFLEIAPDGPGDYQNGQADEDGSEISLSKFQKFR